MPDDDKTADDKWAQYPCTILEFAPPDRLRIDLRRPLGAPERATLAALGLDRPFAVLTAENPMGENAEDEPTETQEAATERRNAARRRCVPRSRRLCALREDRRAALDARPGRTG